MKIGFLYGLKFFVIKCRFKLITLLFAIPVLICHAEPTKGNIKFHKGIVPLQLTCEFKTNPLGIDKLHPRFSWELKAITLERNQYQTAFQIQMATSEEQLLSGNADLWDTLKSDTSQNNNIRYEGKKLQSGLQCFWRVRVWDKYHHVSAWSKMAYFTMGLLHPSDWKGKWIKDSKVFSGNDSMLYRDLPAPIFRNEFSITKKIRSAILYVSGLGYYEAFLNGHRVGNHFLDPGWTDYSKRVFYSTYDITSLLEAGKNCFGIMLGNGWYDPLSMLMWGRLNLRKELVVGQPQFILQLNITYDDGKVISVVSDKDWKVTDGPVIRNNIYLGEKYDDRKKLQDWNKPGFYDNAWRGVEASDKKLGQLHSQPQLPIVVGETLIPKSITRISSGKYLVDFGRNFGGIIRLKAEGKPGDVIHIRYGELLYPDGSVNVMTSVAGQIKHAGLGGSGAPDTAYARDTFILNGKGEEVFDPQFTFHGFRYAEISGYPRILQSEDIQGLVLHSDVSDAGNFSCSDTLLNQIQQACRNTFLSNLFSVQSDCPHRERFGYGGDILATCEAFMNNFNMSDFYAKAVQDYSDAARSDGGLTETAPYVGIADAGLGGESGPIEWGSVLPVLLYRLYQYYGNIELIKEQYNVAKRWVDFIGQSQYVKNFIVNRTLGDWESIAPKSIALSGTAFYYYNAHLMAYFAGLLEKQQDAIKYTKLANKIKNAFIEKFIQNSTGVAGNHTEADQSYALYFHLLPSSKSVFALSILLNDINIKNQGHISTGMFGTKFILEVLSDAGYGNVAYKMASQKTFPGWGYMIGHGATTIWEHWAFSDNTFSHNHPMFGSVSEWFYKHIAGIQPDTDAVAYNKIIIHPDITLRLSWAKASYHSINGIIESKWEKEGDKFKLHVIIPVNTTALIYIPANNIDSITENWKNIHDADWLKLIGIKGNFIVVKVGSGSYDFVSTSFKNR